MFKECSTSHCTVSFWFAKFCCGDFSIENEPHGRLQPVLNIHELIAIVESDASQTTRKLASTFCVPIPIILHHLRQIRKVEKLDRWVSHKLNAHQMKKRFDASVSFLSRNEGEPFLHLIVTCDEKWILYYNCSIIV